MTAASEIVFTFPDTRNALASEKILLSAGIAVRIMPRPSALGEGCGICIRVDEEEREMADSILRTAGIHTDGAFRKTREQGATRYRKL